MKRDTGMDLLRIFAAFSVLSVHFFLNCGYYYVPLVGKRLLIMTIIRSFFMICVPLFITLTGYLMNKKELSARYYFGIAKTLFVYIVASVFCVLYKMYFLSTEYTLRTFIGGLFNFTDANYSWYIEMYICLFLMIPFLNGGYHSLKSQNQKRILVLSFVFLTALPGVLNIFSFTTVEWWSHPTLTNNYAKIIPDFFKIIYPVTYYYIGAYLREYGLKIKKPLSLIFIVITTACAGLFSFYRTDGGNFVWGAWQDWGSLFNLINTTLVFSLFIGIKWTEKLPDGAKRFIKTIADLMLGTYLLSYIFDSFFYKFLNEKIIEVPDRMKYYFIIVPIVFISSTLLSGIIELLYLPLGKAINKKKS